ncbi:adhesive plaque matrix protein-like [Argopecten irradians]|uniref:adhesive plaque matrix protein-like n=1 Tax=Argopecten irradians TaxID=31199 RepID=UPI00372035CB
MNIWTITITLLLQFTPCYLQSSGWWSGQQSPPASQNNRPGAQGNNPGGQVVNPEWNQAPKSWPNTEPSGWKASQKRHANVQTRNMNGPNRRRPPPNGRPVGNAARNPNWKPSVFPYPHSKKPSAPPQWSVKSGSSTWRAPGMKTSQPYTRNAGNSWGRKRTPNHKTGQAPKPHEVVKGWTSTGTQSLWTDQGNNKNAQATTLPSVRPRPPRKSWMQKRPTELNTQQNNGNTYHPNRARRPYPYPRPGDTAKPYPPTGYTQKPFPRSRYTPKPYSYPEITPKPFVRPGPPTAREPVTRPPPNRRPEDRSRFPSPRPRFDTPTSKPRDPMANRPTRPSPSTSGWSEHPSPTKPARGGRFETSPGQSFHRAERKRVEFKEPRQSAHTAPRRQPPNEPPRINTVQSKESRRRKPEPTVESILQASYRHTQPTHINAVTEIEPTVPSNPVPTVHSRVDNEPLPSMEPNQITNTPKMNSDHFVDPHNEPIHSDTFTDMGSSGRNTIAKSAIKQVMTVPTNDPVPAHTEPPRATSEPRATPTRKEKTKTKARKEKSKSTKAANGKTTDTTRHINDLSDKSNAPVPQESVQMAVEVKPVPPTKAAEQQRKRDPMTAKIIAELKRKLKLLSESEQAVVNDSLSVLEAMQQSVEPPALKEAANQPKTQAKPKAKSLDAEQSTGKSRSKARKQTRVATSAASSPDRHQSEFTHNTDAHYEEIAEPRRTKLRRTDKLDAHPRSQMNDHANIEPVKADIPEVGYYEGVTEIRPRPTAHVDDGRHASRSERRHHSRRRNGKRPADHTLEPTIEFIGEQYADSHTPRGPRRQRPVSEPRPAAGPTDNRNPAEGHAEPLSVYDSKTDTYIEPPPNFTPRPKSEADIWGKSKPTHPAPPSPWGPDSHGPDPHMGPPSPHIPDPYAAPSDPHAQPHPSYNDDGWSRHQPGYQHPAANTDLHRAAPPGYAPDPYQGHPQGPPNAYDYHGGPQAPYPPEAYPPQGPHDPYHPAGPPEPPVGHPGAYYPGPPQPPPYPPVDPYHPPPTVNSGPVYHTPATIPTTTDDDPPAPPTRASVWAFQTPQPPAGQHPPAYQATPSPLTNFDPYPGPGYAPAPPRFNQYTIRYPDGSASKEEYTEVTSAVQRIVNYVYDNAMRIYKIADYFVMDRNTDSFAIRIAKDMCYVGTLDSAILDSFTQYTLKTRNVTEPVIHSNNRLFFFKEIEQVFFNDVNATRGGYIAGSCGDAFIFRVRMVKPRMINMPNGSLLPGTTCPYGEPLKEARGAVTSCKAGYCRSRDHTCNPTHHICCPKMPTSTRCMSLSIGKFCVSYSKNNVIIN